MDLEKAIKRLVWRFENFEVIRVNENDLDAIDVIVDFANNYKYRPFYSNIHFSKLYAYVILDLLKKYKTSIDSPIVHGKINKILNTSFKILAKDIADYLNDFIRQNLLEKAGYKNKFHLNQEERTQVLNNLSMLLKNKTNKEYLYNGAWTQNEIEEGLINQINSFLNETQKNQ